MDPSLLVKTAIHEIALDGVYGMDDSALWELCASLTGCPLDPDLKDAIWLWVAGNQNITVKKNTLFASEDLQWLTLTGFPRAENPVGNLTFELLCLIAHNRKQGISTVEASQQTGQDLRSLFGRVQTLVNLGIVHRFPVIENGSSTNRMVFHTYSDSLSVSESVIDKHAICSKIIEYCKSGIQCIRSVRDIVREVGSTLTNTKISRRRPTIMGSLKELEALGCIRKVAVIHPEYPEKQFSCVEYVKDFQAQGSDRGNDVLGILRADSTVGAPNNLGGGGDDDENDEHDEDQGEDEEDDLKPEDIEKSNFDNRPASALTKIVLSNGGSDETHANTISPLQNQIFDTVQNTGSHGVSAMQLTKTLTGRRYSKALGKYLNDLTTSPSSGSVGEIPQLGHLSLVKGVDFNRRVKFYRYFTKLAYSNIRDPPEEWGCFLPNKSPSVNLSLKQLDRDMKKHLPGICSVVKRDDGLLTATFHGDKTIKGDVVLRSGPTDAPALVDGAPRKRGRPRKDEKRSAVKIEPSHMVGLKYESNQAGCPPGSQNVPGVVPLDDRVWVGGHHLSKNLTPSASRWLQSSELSLPGQAKNITHTSSDSRSGGASRYSKEKVETKNASDMKDPSIGSLAHRQRAETLLNIVEMHGGVMQGGAPLLEKFNDAVSGKYMVDRRTVNAVVDRLVKDGRLRKICINAPTASGRYILKFILYDPAKIKFPDTDPAIARAKAELIEGNREKHGLATRTALCAARDAIKNLPMREMTDEQMEAFKPRLIQSAPHRILTTRTGKSRRTQKEKTRFGPSAAEVLGVDNEGRLQSRSKKLAVQTNSSPDADSRSIRARKRSTPHLLSKPVNSTNEVVDTTDELESSSPISTLPVIDLDELARSVIVYRSLFSSNNGTTIDWKLIATSLSRPVSASDARRHWQEARAFLASQETDSRAADAVYKKSEEFETLFFLAYRAQRVAFDRLEAPAAAIPRYVDWWRQAEDDNLLGSLLSGNKGDSETGDSGMSQAAQRLSRLSLKDRKIDYVEIDPFASLQTQASIVNAEKLLLSHSFGVPIGKSLLRSPRLTDDEMRLRAVIAADYGPTYSPEMAARELTGLTNGDTELAKSGLELKRVIQWGENDREKVPAGRPFVLSEQVTNALSVPKLDPSMPRRVAEDLDFFVKSVESTDIPATVGESDMIYLMELCTFGLQHKHVKLERVGEKFGLLSKDYKSRGIDKHEFECNLVCRVIDDAGGLSHATQSVPAGNGESVDSPLNEQQGLYVAPPHSDCATRPWLWETRYLTSRSIWFKVSYRILSLVHFRPGVTIDAIALALRNALEYDETVAAVTALREGRALRQRTNGYFAVPNWFEFLSSVK